MLAIQGETDLTDFCNTAADNNIFGCSQSVRNAVAKAERKGLIEFAKVENQGFKRDCYPDYW